MRPNETMPTRRVVLGGAAAVGALALLGAAPHETSFADEPTELKGGEANPPTRDAQYGFLVKLRNCIDCGACVRACRLWNRTPDEGDARRRIETFTNEIGREYHVSISCMQCENPACVSVCPAGAISKGDGGVVSVDKERCIGCKYCYQACPYGAPHYFADGMDKCDCCLGNGVPLGEEPHCVQACKCNALYYGTTAELAEMAGSRGERLDGATSPAFFLM